MNPCIFCRIASHDETPAWILRESHEHMAFLTPFPNTPGVTVVATKLHHPSDLLEIPESTYVSLMRFGRSVAQDRHHMRRWRAVVDQHQLPVGERLRVGFE